MKVITKGWPEDNEVLLSDASITYVQDGDCTEGSDVVQELTISTRDNGIDRFLNFKTNSWSIDNYKELIKIFKDFCQRVSYKDEDIESISYLFMDKKDSFEEILYLLLEMHRRCPYIRFGQLLCNIGITMDMEGKPKDIFNTPNENIKIMIDNYGPKSSS